MISDVKYCFAVQVQKPKDCSINNHWSVVWLDD
jgi:hypothetical protein